MSAVIATRSNEVAPVAPVYAASISQAAETGIATQSFLMTFPISSRRYRPDPAANSSLGGLPVSFVDHLLRRSMAALERRRRAVVWLRVADRDRADGRELVRHAEGLAEFRLIRDTEEHRAESGIHRGHEDEQRGHPGVDVPVRHGPALLVHIGPAFISLRVS